MGSGNPHRARRCRPPGSPFSSPVRRRRRCTEGFLIRGGEELRRSHEGQRPPRAPRPPIGQGPAGGEGSINAIGARKTLDGSVFASYITITTNLSDCFEQLYAELMKPESIESEKLEGDFWLEPTFYF